MKNVSKIFVWAFIILSLLPVFEFFLFQWRNDNRVGIDTTASISVISYPTASDSGYVVYFLPTEINSFTDYVLAEYSYGIIQPDSVNLQGLAKPIFQTMALITRRMASATASGPFLVHIIAISLLLSRCVYIACILLLIYIIIFPVLLVSSSFRRKT